MLMKLTIGECRIGNFNFCFVQITTLLIDLRQLNKYLYENRMFTNKGNAASLGVENKKGNAD